MGVIRVSIGYRDYVLLPGSCSRASLVETFPVPLPESDGQVLVVRFLTRSHALHSHHFNSQPCVQVLRVFRFLLKTQLPPHATNHLPVAASTSFATQHHGIARDRKQSTLIEARRKPSSSWWTDHCLSIYFKILVVLDYS
jgi:hypothetical protein